MNKIFVFGSNLAGRHGAGAAKFARLNKGAIYGKFYGLQGESFAIPTKDQYLASLPISKIRVFVDRFINFAKQNPDMVFELTPIGCGLAGYMPEEIAPLFENAPENVELPEDFKIDNS
jgi:hypothetical protein